MRRLPGMKNLPSWVAPGQYIALPAPSTDRAKIVESDPETGVTLIDPLNDGDYTIAVRAKFIRRCFPVTADGQPNLPATPKLISSHEASDNAAFDKIVLELLDTSSGTSVRDLASKSKSPMATTREALDRLHTAGKVKCFTSGWVRVWTPLPAERPDHADNAAVLRVLNATPASTSLVAERAGFTKGDGFDAERAAQALNRTRAAGDVQLLEGGWVISPHLDVNARPEDRVLSVLSDTQGATVHAIAARIGVTDPEVKEVLLSLKERKKAAVVAAGWIRTVYVAPPRLSPLAHALLLIVYSKPGVSVVQAHAALLTTTKLTPTLDESHAELDRMERNGLIKTKEGKLNIEPKGDEVLLDRAGQPGG